MNDAEKKGLQERLAQARSAKKRVEEAREIEESSDAALLRQVEREEREAMEAELLAKFEAEHGKQCVGSIDTDLGMVIVKRANAVLFKRFQDSGEVKSIDLEKLVRPCVIHPSADRFDAMCDAQPAILNRAADRVATLAGVRARELSGK